jgi:hypothetical protein
MFIPGWGIAVICFAVIILINSANKEGRENMRKYMEEQQERETKWVENYNNSEAGKRSQETYQQIQEIAKRNGNQKI